MNRLIYFIFFFIFKTSIVFSAQDYCKLNPIDKIYEIHIFGQSYYHDDDRNSLVSGLNQIVKEFCFPPQVNVTLVLFRNLIIQYQLMKMFLLQLKILLIQDLHMQLQKCWVNQVLLIIQKNIILIV